MAAKKKQVQEGLIEHAAFELYLSMGSERSFKEVAKKMKRTVKEIESWAGMFTWGERVSHRESKLKRKLEEATDKSLIEVARTYRTILNELVEEFTSRPVQIDNVSDLLKVMKMDADLAKVTDTPTSDRGELADLSADELRERIRQKREARLEHDQITVRRFGEFDHIGAAGAIEAGGRDRLPPQASEVGSIHAAPEDISVPHIPGKQAGPQWRKSVPAPDNERSTLERIMQRNPSAQAG